MWKQKTVFLLAATLAVGTLVGGVAFVIDRLQNRALEEEMENRAGELASFGLACQKYAIGELRPLVRDEMYRMVTDEVFGWWVARDIFEYFNKEMPGYTYRQATPGSLHAPDRADDFERQIVDMFNEDPKLREVKGHRKFDGRGQCYVARPVVVEKKCLECHGATNVASTSSLGNANPHQHNWCEGRVVSAQMVYYFVDDFRASQLLMRWVVLGIFALLALALIGATYIVFARLIDRTAELRVASRQAEAASRAKGEFLANMSHELRTPMTAIMGYTDMLSEICPRKCLAAHSLVGDPLDVIRRNSWHLLRLIDDVLDLSKIEAGELKVEHVLCSPRNIVSEVVSLMTVRAEAKGLVLDVEYQGTIPQAISSDPARLRQILVNLVGNAVKFTEAGRVELVVGVPHAASDNPLLQIQVVDMGIGMSAESLARLFSPFTQADNSITRRFGGTGLGLAISKRLAELLGGDISVSSTLGKGSTFTLRVPTGPLAGIGPVEPSASTPRKETVPFSSNENRDSPPLTVPFSSNENRESPPPIDSPSPSDIVPQKAVMPAGCRLLVVEDCPDNQRLIVFLLKKAGAEVAVAENGQIACELALARQHGDRQFDAILMDMQMPVMDGYEATRRLRAAGYEGPVIALTAHAMSADRQKCLDVGCTDYLTKPIIDRNQVLNTVARHVAQSSHRTAVSPRGS